MNSNSDVTSRTVTALGPQLRRRKSIKNMVGEAESNSGQLRRTLGMWQLTMISVGATMGTGILVILGAAVPIAGPAIWISFVIAGVTALLSAVSYAEMAGMVPVSGSSYSYSYATMGEGIAWICGWCLVLEYAVSVAAVAVGAGEYVNQTLRAFNLELPVSLAGGPAEGGVVNLPALIVVVLATLLLVRGARESAIVNTVVVIIKAGILVFFSIVAFSAFNAGNFEPLLPMGAAGVTAAASSVFFSYIGFDAASTAGEEAKNPKRDLPRAIMLSMLIVTITYVLVAVSAIGAREWTWFVGTEAALVQIVGELTGQPIFVLIFALASVLAIASVVLTVLYGQTRILMSMSRDGLVPAVFGKVSKWTGTPVAGTFDHRHRGGYHRRVHPARCASRRHQHRYPVCLRIGGRFGDVPASTPTAGTAHLPRAAVPNHPDSWNFRLPVPDEPAGLAHLGGLSYLDAGGHCYLPGLRSTPFALRSAEQTGLHRQPRGRKPLNSTAALTKTKDLQD